MKILSLTLFALTFIKPFAHSQHVTTVPSVDLERYAGKWYEVASIPQSFQKQCVSNTTAEYSLLRNGLVKVMNSCQTASGEINVAEGRAKVVDTETRSKLKVTFVNLFGWVFAFGGKYWIVDLAPDYSYALIGHPKATYAWILSRTPALSIETYQHAEAVYRRMGYDTCKILTSVQTGGSTARTPLCEVVK